MRAGLRGGQGLTRSDRAATLLALGAGIATIAAVTAATAALASATAMAFAAATLTAALATGFAATLAAGAFAVPARGIAALAVAALRPTAAAAAIASPAALKAVATAFIALAVAFTGSRRSRGRSRRLDAKKTLQPADEAAGALGLRCGRGQAIALLRPGFATGLTWFEALAVAPGFACGRAFEGIHFPGRGRGGLRLAGAWLDAERRALVAPGPLFGGRRFPVGRRALRLGRREDV